LAYEAGLKPWELRRVTLRDFNAMYVGYRRRQEEMWDIARNTWSYMMVYGGMGLKKDAKVPSPQELYPLQFRDKEMQMESGAAKAKPITSIEEAFELLKEFD
jgi:hypothetical protein